MCFATHEAQATIAMGHCSSSKLSRRHDDFLRTCSRSGYNGLSTLISKINQVSLICPMKTTGCDVFSFNFDVKVMCSPEDCRNWLHIKAKIQRGICLVKEKRNNLPFDDYSRQLNESLAASGNTASVSERERKYPQYPGHSKNNFIKTNSKE